MSDFSGIEHHIRRQLSALRCSFCQRSYENGYVRLAAKFDEFCIVRVRCRHCQHRQIYWLPVTEGASDLSPEEERRFATLPPLSPDDVLDVHEFLRDFDGDFQRLFQD